MTLEGYASRKQLPGDPVFGGMGFTGYSAIFGLRLSGGLHVARGTGAAVPLSGYSYQCGSVLCTQPQSNSQHGNSSLFVSAWTADADVLLEPLRSIAVAKALLLGFSPYAFFGVGGYGVRAPGAADSVFATLSYGAGAHHQLLGWLGVEAEARYRRPIHSDSALSFGTPRNWEYRIGLTASFGGGSQATRSYAMRDATMESAPTSLEGEPHYYVRRGAYLVETPFSTRLGTRVLSAADALVGSDYRTGGDSPGSGFDGPGFVHYVFEQDGVRLPRSASAMAEVGDRVVTRPGSLRPGDLLFFANDRRHINHVAIYAGGDRIVHATASGGGVRYDVLGDAGGARGRWFDEHLVMARRILADARWNTYPEDRPDAPDRAPRPNRWPW